jgi:magnesium transporter
VNVGAVTTPRGRDLIDAGGVTPRVTREAIEQRLHDKSFFWLDLHSPGADDVAILRDVFHFHPLSIEDSERFGQRPKLDEYDEFLHLVVYGISHDDGELVEVHCYICSAYLVTIHRHDLPALDDIRERYVHKQATQAGHQLMLLHQVVDTLADSFFPVLSDLDDGIDALEDAIIKKPTDQQLQQMFAIKRQLVELRKVVTPQRDLFARLASGVVEFPGMQDDEVLRYFRDVYDHLIRISDLVDTYRDLMTGAMDVYLSTVSNRLNDVMKKLTIIATIFLPLSWLTGFFGQNFGFLILHITGWVSFVGFGLGGEVAAVLVLLYVFRRRGWL